MRVLPFSRILTLPAIASLLLLVSCAVSESGPPNLSLAKQEVATYADSGEYRADLGVVAGRAARWIEARAGRGGGRLAVVFDIDETVLSNLPHMKESDWGYREKEWDKWMARTAAPAILPVREVYQTALDRGVAVFFITGRTAKDRRHTARNLALQGMGKYEQLITRPDGPKEPAAVFKSARRREISSRSFTIIANIGDQATDLEGGFAERDFKLPNPFYLIP